MCFQGKGANCQQKASVQLKYYGKKFITEEINSVFAMAYINTDGAMGEIDKDGRISLFDFAKTMLPIARNRIKLQNSTSSISETICKLRLKKLY